MTCNILGENQIQGPGEVRKKKFQAIVRKRTGNWKIMEHGSTLVMGIVTGGRIDVEILICIYLNY